MDTERVPPHMADDPVQGRAVDDKNGRALCHCRRRKPPLENQ